MCGPLSRPSGAHLQRAVPSDGHFLPRLCVGRCALSNHAQRYSTQHFDIRDRVRRRKESTAWCTAWRTPARFGPDLSLPYKRRFHASTEPPPPCLFNAVGTTSQRKTPAKWACLSRTQIPFQCRPWRQGPDKPRFQTPMSRGCTFFGRSAACLRGSREASEPFLSGKKRPRSIRDAPGSQSSIQAKSP